MSNTTAMLWILVIVEIVGFVLILSPQVNQWERANGYPYGQMCNSIFTGYINTCPTR